MIEANSDSASNLGQSEAEAVALGAHIVSNSYIETGASQSYYETKDVTYLAAAGDDGYGIEDSADFGSVVSVGGTTLTQGGGGKRGWSETVWGCEQSQGCGEGTGAGCSTDTKPAWQHDPGCTFRTANDVAADGNPDTGPSIYDSYYERGWFQVGGTSVATPLLAGVYGLAGYQKKQDGGREFWAISKSKRDKTLYKITSGSDGTCSPTYLCTDGTKEYKDYGGPTGWGSPHDIGAFSPPSTRTPGADRPAGRSPNRFVTLD